MVIFTLNYFNEWVLKRKWSITKQYSIFSLLHFTKPVTIKLFILFLSYGHPYICWVKFIFTEEKRQRRKEQQQLQQQQQQQQQQGQQNTLQPQPQMRPMAVGAACVTRPVTSQPLHNLSPGHYHNCTSLLHSPTYPKFSKTFY